MAGIDRSLLPERCANCPMKDQPFVKGHGPTGCYAVIGEAPGASEAARGQPFVGESGRLLRLTLRACGINPDEEVFYTNSVGCRPPQNATPGIDQIRSCNARLKTELQLVKPKKVLTVGGIGLTASRMLGTNAPTSIMPITKNRGRGVWTYGISRDPAFTVSTYHPAAVMRDTDAWRDFADDIQKLHDRDAPYTSWPCDIVVCDSPREALEWLDELWSATKLTLDLESTGTNPVKDKIVAWVFTALTHESDPQGLPVGLSVIIPHSFLRSPAVLQSVRRYVSGEWPGQLTLHNAKFDLQFVDVLYETFLRPHKVVDTMLLHYCTDERPFGRWLHHGLKALARVHFDADYGFDFEAWYKAGSPDSWLPKLYEYQGLDGYFTAVLEEQLRAEADEESPRLVELHDNILIPGWLALKEIELHGARLDLEYLQVLEQETVEECDEMHERLKAMAAKTGMGENFNPNSPLQIKELVFNRWKLPKSAGNTRYGAADSTDKEALQHLTLKTNDPGILEGLKLIMEYRLKTKVLQTYIRGLQERVDEDGRIRADFMLMGTATGRLSCRDPNLQNIPTLMGQQIRDAFIATEGYTFVEVDYSQLELRIAAHLSQDEVMIRTFEDGRDIHREVASQMFDIPPEKINKYQRYLAKYVDFGIIYGRGASSLVNGWEMVELEALGGKRWTVQEGEFFLRKLMNGFPGLQRWMAEIKEQTLRQQYVETQLGRRRRFPYIAAGDRNAVGRQAVNTPCQSLASDVCLMALTRLHSKLPEGAYLLFTVHDALYFEVRNDLLEEVLPMIKREMEIPPFETRVPIVVEVKAGERWGSCEEVEWVNAL